MYKSIFTLSFSNALFSISSLLGLAVLSKLLELDQYGLFAFSLSLAITIQTIFNTQSWQGILKLDKYYNNLLYKCFLVDITTSSLGAITYLITIQWLTAILTGGEFQLWQFTLAVSVLFTPNGTALSVIRKQNKFFGQSIVDSIAAIFRLALMILCYILDVDAYVAVAAYTLPEALRWIGYVLISYQAKPNQIKNNEVVFKDILTVYKFSIWGVLNEIAHLPSAQLDRLICASFISLEVLALYDIIKRICTSVVYVTNPIIQVVYPNFISSIKENGLRSSFYFLKKTISLLLLFTTCIYFLIFISKNVWGSILFSIPESTWLEGYELLLILFCMSLIVTFSFVPVHPFFLALGKARMAFFISFFGSLIYLITIYCIAYFSSFYYLPLAILLSDGFIISFKLREIYKEIS
ncbi:TPA: oligosaccharide flippase family protein [Vibrio parahaemolyticus]|uniref:lipopolysaccharide biosynthesis protein n=1 Tax=Vibrio parahaemolyticus TaxID=670 RepID=UPI00042A8303|nr:oligosaccharide flippase family protein [Vibrio parahaemolyticus]HCE3509554.1 oligosaccharide flippase family protein [Vibrio parahaemolyticus]